MPFPDVPSGGWDGAHAGAFAGFALRVGSAPRLPGLLSGLHLLTAHAFCFKGRRLALSHAWPLCLGALDLVHWGKSEVKLGAGIWPRPSCGQPSRHGRTVSEGLSPTTGRSPWDKRWSRGQRQTRQRPPSQSRAEPQGVRLTHAPTSAAKLEPVNVRNGLHSHLAKGLWKCNVIVSPHTVSSQIQSKTSARTGSSKAPHGTDTRTLSQDIFSLGLRCPPAPKTLSGAESNLQLNNSQARGK